MRNFVLFLFSCCSALFVLLVVQADPSVSPMQKKEQQALYSTIQGFVGQWWNGSDLYPDPCGWTPIQGVYCELYNGFWYVAVINIGPIYDNYLHCSPNAEFSHQLFKLNHLKVLSFFNCFVSPITISYLNWEKISNSLESLEFLDLSNTFLTRHIPNSLAEMRRLRFLGLNNNNLSGRISPRLESLPCIGALYLYGNNFTGEVEFSEWFYRKMGRRFGAWNNPNLCYRAEANSTHYVPYGVKSCQQETTFSSDNVPHLKLQ